MLKNGTRATYKGVPGTVETTKSHITFPGQRPQPLFHLRYDVPQSSRDPQHPNHKYVGAFVTAERLVVQS